MTRWLAAHPAVRHAESYPFERPLLHACSNNGTFLGDVRVDIRPLPNIDVIADVRALPFTDGSFGSAFADFPWSSGFKKEIAAAMHELCRVAGAVYTLSPWTWGCSGYTCDWAEIAWQPGVNSPLIFAKYRKQEAK